MIFSNKVKSAIMGGALALLGLSGVNSHAASASGVAVTGASISTGSLNFTWNIGAQASALVVLSTDNFTTIVSSMIANLGLENTGTTTYPNGLVPGLAPNTTHWFQVKSTTDTDPGGYTTALATSTLASPPTSFFNTPASVSTFSAVNSAFIGVQFSSGAGTIQVWGGARIDLFGYNTVGTTYTVVLSTVNIAAGTTPTFPGNITTSGGVSLTTAPVRGASNVPNATLALPGNTLVNTVYYLYANAINHNGIPSVFVGPLSSTSTLALAPAAATSSTFTSVGATGMTVSFLSNGNPLNITTYTVVLSTVNGTEAQVIGAQDNFVNLTTMTPTGTSGSFTSTAISTKIAAGYLRPNTTYFLYANAVNFSNVGSTFAALGSTATLAVAPTDFYSLPGSISTFSVVTSSIMSVSWASGTAAGQYNPLAVTSYTVTFSTWNTFNTATSGNVSLTTMPAGAYPSASVSGLLGNTTYFPFIRAVSIESIPTSWTSYPSTTTQALPPGSASPSSIGSASAVLNWVTTVNSTNTVYFVQVSSDPTFAVWTATSALTTSTFTAVSLGAGQNFYSRVRANSWNGGTSAFTDLPIFATTGGPSAPTAAAFTGVAIASITANWTSVSGVSTYRVVASTDSAFGTIVASSITANTSAKFGAGGEGGTLALKPNFLYYFAVQSTGTTGASIFASLGSTYTLAANPTASQLKYTGGVGQVFATSATFNWTMGVNEFGLTNEPTTGGEIRRSSTTDFSVSVTSIIAANVGGTPTYTDTSLLGCTTYFYRIASSNGNGVPSSFDPATLAAPFLSVVTSNTIPAPPVGLTINPQDGNKLAINWNASPTEGTTNYQLYWDSGTGISITTGLTVGTSLAPHLFAVFTGTVTSYTTPVLNSSTTYKFLLTAKHRCGVEEPVGAFAFAGSTGTLASVRASVTSPLAGAYINGGAAAQGGSNAVPVSADLVSGSPSSTLQVVFQYQPAGASSWVNIGTATAVPYVVRWNPSSSAQGVGADANTTAANQAGFNLSNNNTVTACPGTVSPVAFNGFFGCLYNLRAVAYDLNGTSDTFAGSVQIHLIPTMDASSLASQSAATLNTLIGFESDTIGANATTGITNTAAVVELKVLSDATTTNLAVAGGGFNMGLSIGADGFGGGPGILTLCANAQAAGDAAVLPSGYSQIHVQATNAPSSTILPAVNIDLTAPNLTSCATTPKDANGNFTRPCTETDGSKWLAKGAKFTVSVTYPDTGGANGLTGTIAGTTPPLRADQATFLTSVANPLGPYAKDNAVKALTPDLVRHLLKFEVPHATFFLAAGALGTDLSAVRVYPVPWKPNGADANEGRPVAAGALPGPNQGIIFDFLPPNFTIKIYTVSGQLVTQKTVSGGLGTGQLIWDGRNDAARDVASGGYFAVISSPGIKSIVKRLAIIR